MREIAYGTRVRAKARTIGGWKGTGTYVWDGCVLKDGADMNGWDYMAHFADFELAIMRDQTPNPAHASELERMKASHTPKAT